MDTHTGRLLIGLPSQSRLFVIFGTSIGSNNIALGDRSFMIIVLGDKNETTIGGEDGVTNLAKTSVVGNDHSMAI